MRIVKITGARGDWTAQVEGQRLAVIHNIWWTPPDAYHDPMIGAKIDGKRYACNQLRHTVINRAHWSTGLYEFSAINSQIRIRGAFRATPVQLITAPYHDPDGDAVYCANTEIGDVELTMQLRQGFGWSAQRVLKSVGSAHFETGSQQADPMVTRMHKVIG